MRSIQSNSVSSRVLVGIPSCNQIHHHESPCAIFPQKISPTDVDDSWQLRNGTGTRTSLCWLCEKRNGMLCAYGWEAIVARRYLSHKEYMYCMSYMNMFVIHVLSHTSSFFHHGNIATLTYSVVVDSVLLFMLKSFKRDSERWMRWVAVCWLFALFSIPTVLYGHMAYRVSISERTMTRYDIKVRKGPRRTLRDHDVRLSRMIVVPQCSM